jgi:hypothetical protein
LEVGEMKRIAAMLVLASAVSLLVWQGVAGASAGTDINWTMHGTYTCNDPLCTTTTGSGTAHADSRALGAMTWTNAGGGSDAMPQCPRDQVGFALAETWVFRTQDGSTLDVETTSDSLCLVSHQLATETATFTITGGTGRFAGASGSGTFSIVDLTSPSNENGQFRATINP